MQCRPGIIAGMSRSLRPPRGGLVYHVMNRGNGGRRIFRKRSDYLAFIQILREALAEIPIRILAYCLTPVDWRLLLWPQEDRGEDLSKFMHWITLTHASRWHAHRGTRGQGHLYQRRFKSFPAQPGGHVSGVIRFTEQTPLRTGLAEKLEDWEWSSYRARTQGADDRTDILSALPRSLSRSWQQSTEQPLSRGQIAAMRECVHRGRPYGDETWTAEIAEELGLQSTLRPIGRPRRPTGINAPLTLEV